MVYTVRYISSGNNRNQQIGWFNSDRLYYFFVTSGIARPYYFCSAECRVRRLPLAALPHTAFIQYSSAHTDDCHWSGGEHRRRCFHLPLHCLPSVCIMPTYRQDYIGLCHSSQVKAVQRAETVMCRLPSLSAYHRFAFPGLVNTVFSGTSTTVSYKIQGDAHT